MPDLISLVRPSSGLIGLSKRSIRSRTYCPAAMFYFRCFPTLYVITATFSPLQVALVAFVPRHAYSVCDNACAVSFRLHPFAVRPKSKITPLLFTRTFRFFVAAFHILGPDFHVEATEVYSDRRKQSRRRLFHSY